MTARRPPIRLAAALAAASALCVTIAVVTAPEHHAATNPRVPSGLVAPVAAGDSAANVQLDRVGERVLVRWVARSSGTLAALHLRIQADGSDCRQSGRTGYGAGDGGSWHATTHPVLADGRPDPAVTLATNDFRPCQADTQVADVRQGIVRLALDIRVKEGAEYATVISNRDPDPAHNYTSTNFLYTSNGIIGANGRNERDPNAPDSYYGLDPRELVGYSDDGGQTWALPGGRYGDPGGRNFLPTYLQEYTNGQITGQPYYYTGGVSTTRTMAFTNITRPWTIRELGAYTATPGAGTLTLTIDGQPRAAATVQGAGMLRAPIPPTTANPGQTVKVTANGLAIQDIVADTAWGRLIGMQLRSAPWRLEGQGNFVTAAPVYPLPRPPLPLQSRGPAQGG